MKATLFTVAAVALLATALTACSPSGANVSQPAPTQAPSVQGAPPPTPQPTPTATGDAMSGGSATKPSDSMQGGSSAMKPADSTPGTDSMQKSGSGAQPSGAMAPEGTMPADSSAMKPGDSMQGSGRGVMPAEGAMMSENRIVDYSPAALTRATQNGRAVLFFSDGMCAACAAAEQDLQAHLDTIPRDVTILRVNYDTATDLKSKYNVTAEPTFIQVNAAGDEVSRWSGGMASDLLAGLK